DVPSEEVEALRHRGWRLLLTQDDLLELVHLQAWYFQVRFFPQLQWIVLDAPPGGYFVIGDRPVVWGFDSHLEVAPTTLRPQEVELIAPLTRSLALFACSPAASPPGTITYHEVNHFVAAAADEWIAGPARDVVVAALAGRHEPE